jgi:aspartate aminotransferase
MTGWRLGYLAADKEIAKVVSTLQSHSTSNPTSFAQVAAQAALEGPQDEVARRCKIFEERRNKICKEIDRISQLSYVRPQGAFYIFCGTDKVGMGSIELCEKLLDEARVAAVPGIVFGDDRAIRLSFAMSDQEMVEGLKRISEWLSKK